MAYCLSYRQTLNHYTECQSGKTLCTIEIGNCTQFFNSLQRKGTILSRCVIFYSLWLILQSSVSVRLKKYLCLDLVFFLLRCRDVIMHSYNLLCHSRTLAEFASKQAIWFIFQSGKSSKERESVQFHMSLTKNICNPLRIDYPLEA